MDPDMDPEMQTPAPQELGDGMRPKPDDTEKKLVTSLVDRIKADKKHHAPAFKQMYENMHLVKNGAPKGYPKDHYRVNITGRHINQKVTALYAKNPKAVARRAEKLDFAVWDETEQSLMTALEIVQMAQQPGPDGMPMAVPPQMMMQVQQSMELLEDYRAGTERKQQYERIGRTAEVLFHYYTREQSPLDFKTQMKKLVRRTCTNKVGYVRLGYQREMGQNQDVVSKIADFREQIEYTQQLIRDVEDNDREGEDLEVKKRKLEISLEALQKQEFVLLREGLIFDFLRSTAVIPDKLCTSLEGFLEARWLTIQHLYTPEEVKRKFKVDLDKSVAKYKREDDVPDNGSTDDHDTDNNEDMVAVWEHFDKEAGLVYLVCDGHDGFLKNPGAPDVYVEDFWPVYALTFNDVESEDDLYPPADAELMLPMQEEYNRSRQGKREHRRAARPRFLTRKGALSDDEKIRLKTMQPFDVVEVNPMDGADDLGSLVQAMSVPGVDPNLYDVNEIFTDIQLTVGSSEAQFGMAGGATATEASYAQSSNSASVDSNVDDLDSFLTRVARGAGQILFRETSPQTVAEIVGPGALWPEMTLEEIAGEMFLEVEAGSSGKPNQAQEIRNWREMLPFLLQMPNIQPTWLVRESLKRLDDRMDLTEAITENIPSIMALNGMAQVAPDNPENAPDAQGDAGASNAPATPGGPTGTDAPMGNNQQPIM